MTPADDDPRLLVHAYLDGELDPANALAFQQRLAADPALAAECERVATLQEALRTRLAPELPSPDLRRRVEAAIRSRRPRPSWMALAASVLGAAFVGGAATFAVLGRGEPRSVEDAVVADHIRGLMAPQPADVASTDQHTVKPWFNGRVPEAPRVVDLAAQDFPLIGGRIDVVGRRPVPTLVYGHRKHVISLTAVPAPGRPDAAPTDRTDEGYNLVTWTENGVTYWVVSDLARVELGRFAQLFRSEPSQP